MTVNRPERPISRAEELLVAEASELPPHELEARDWRIRAAAATPRRYPAEIAQATRAKTGPR